MTMVSIHDRCDACQHERADHPSALACRDRCDACQHERADHPSALACRECGCRRFVGPTSSGREVVDHPEHYGGKDNPYEAIKVIEAWALGFCLGNAVKYIARAGKKGSDIEDLKKARWYLDREIQARESPS